MLQEALTSLQKEKSEEATKSGKQQFKNSITKLRHNNKHNREHSAIFILNQGTSRQLYKLSCGQNQQNQITV